MPPVAPQQGSRAGLITGLVVFVILTVVFAVLWIFQISENRKVVEAATLNEKSNAEAVTETDKTDPTYQRLQALKVKGGVYGNEDSIFAVAVQERKQIGQTIDGRSDVPADDARAEAAAALDAASKKAGVPVTGKPLLEAINALADKVAALNGEKQGLAAENKALADDKSQAIAARDAATAAQKDAEGKSADMYSALQAKFEAAVKDAADQLNSLKTETSKQIAGLQEAVSQEVAKNQDKDKQIKALTTQNDQAKQRLESTHLDPTDVALRQAKGQITRLQGNADCVIDRGTADQIVKGMTFEVYDANKPLPALDNKGLDPTTNLPVGKGSIEVTQPLSDHSSLCHIVHQEPGKQIAEGDALINIAYNPNHQTTFVVFGKFDLDGRGIGTSADTDVIKRLIEQWHGRVIPVESASQVGTDVDYIVMGLEPKQPNLSDEERTNPEGLAKIAEYEKVRAAYDDIIGRARDLHIPIMNQDRFLYFIGFYDQRTR